MPRECVYWFHFLNIDAITPIKKPARIIDNQIVVLNTNNHNRISTTACTVGSAIPDAIQ